MPESGDDLVDECAEDEGEEGRGDKERDSIKLLLRAMALSLLSPL